jgi:hypothetical protein
VLDQGSRRRGPCSFPACADGIARLSDLRTAREIRKDDYTRDADYRRAWPGATASILWLRFGRWFGRS